MKNRNGIKFCDARRVLSRNGWECVSMKGSHAKFKKDNKSIVLIATPRGTPMIIWKRLVAENKIDEGA